MTGWHRWLLLALLLTTLALRLYRLDLQDVWWDEARNIDVASRAFSQIAAAHELDIHPPIYFYLLHTWMGLAGRTAFAIRFLSTAFGVLFVAQMYALGRRVGGLWVGFMSALGAAFLPFLLGEAQEARMYTVTLSWLAAAAIALLAAARRDERFSWRWLAFSAFSAGALLTHYSAVFALVALWAWAILWSLFVRSARRAWPRLRTILIAGVVTGVLCLPGIPVALRQISGYQNTNLVVPSVASFLASLARVYTLGEYFSGPAVRPWSLALVALLAGGGLLALVAATKGLRGKVNSPLALLTLVANAPGAGPVALVLLWALLPLVAYYLTIADRGTFATRYISVALPAWLLLAGLAMRGWSRAHPALGVAAAVGLVVVLAPGLRTDLFDESHFHDDTRSVIAWLRAETDPQRDIILVDQAYPFGFYYDRWNNSPDKMPPATPAETTPAQYLFVDLNSLADRLTELAAGRTRVYWVRWYQTDTDPRGGTLFLLDKFGTQLGEREFRGYTVTWHEIAPNTKFELADQEHGPLADFGGQVRLEGIDFGGHGPGRTSTLEESRNTLAAADGTVWAVGRWSRVPGLGASGDSDEAKATLRLEDADGSVIAGDDRLLLNDRHVALGKWSETDRPLTVFSLKPAAAAPPGRYTLKLSVYDPRTLMPLSVTSDAAAGVFVVLGQVDLERPSSPPDPALLPFDMRVDARWGDVTLLGRGPLAGEVSPGGALPLDLYWRAEAANADPLQLRLELTPLDRAGETVGVDAPVGGRYPSTSWLGGEVVRQHASLSLPPTLSPGSYRLVARPLSGGDPALSSPVELGKIEVVGRVHNFAAPSVPHRSGATFGRFARLLGFDEPVVAGRSLTLNLFWQAVSASSIPYAVSVQVLNSEGVLVAQSDQQPGAGAFPTNSWVATEVLADRYSMELPEDLPAGAYTLIAKMYDPATGTIVPAAPEDETGPQEFVRLMQVNIP